MKFLLAPFSLLLVTLLSVGCAEISPRSSNQALVGNWIHTRSWNDGTASQQQPLLVTTTLNLNKDGTYVDSCESKSTQTERKWLMSTASGTWDVREDTLIFNQTDVEAGLVPKQKHRTITAKIVGITPDSLTLKAGKQATTYTRHP
jgi:hypothetical protein